MEQATGKLYPLVPRVGVGAIVIYEGKILMVKRGEEPSSGLWAIPGGTLELGETLQECAAREILEETGVTIKVGKCVYVFDFFQRDKREKIKYHFVIIDYAAEYVSGKLKAADDAADARWLAPEDLSALPVSRHTLSALRIIGFLPQ